MSKFTVCPQCRQSLPFPMDACTLCGYRSSRVTPGRVGIGIASACGCFFVVLILAAVLSALIGRGRPGSALYAHVDASNARQVELGMTPDQVQALLGPPDMTNEQMGEAGRRLFGVEPHHDPDRDSWTYHTSDGGTFMVGFYRGTVWYMNFGEASGRTLWTKVSPNGPP